MPVTLSSFSLPEPATLTLPDGAEVALTPLSLFDERALEATVPEPVPPMVKNPAKGSDAPKVPDTDDPGYVRAVVQRYHTLQLARIAVAIGFVIEGVDHTEDDGGVATPLGWNGVRHDDGLARSWVEHVVDTLSRRVDPAWYRAACDALEALGLGEQIAERGEGFTGGASASPTPMPPTT